MFVLTLTLTVVAALLLLVALTINSNLLVMGEELRHARTLLARIAVHLDNAAAANDDTVVELHRGDRGA